jgi:succinate-semialdehyde dehydrogenase/glutarate-semialdehyde dehydrogenase
MGKPISQAIAEIEKCVWVCEYYAAHARRILSEEIIETDALQSSVRFNPLGIVLAIMPWNFPFWQVFRFAAPALMAGNAGLLKHASNVPLCALAIEELFYDAGFPQNVFRTLLIGSSHVEEVITNTKVKAVTLTGSEPAGKQVAEACGKVLKKSVMELGGSDPFIVLDDANIDCAVQIAVAARNMNNGQSCIAAKRFIVTEKVYGEFENKFITLMKNVQVGDPTKAETEVGPIAREDLLNELEMQIQLSVQKGAIVLCGGKRIKSEGYFLEPTILSNVLPGMPAYEEELFGPVASLIKAKDEDDALRIANDSRYGLGASLWTNDIEHAKELANVLECGSVFINGMVKSDPRLPFGGIKYSGYGRELSHYGIKEFLNIKTVWIK